MKAETIKRVLDGPSTNNHLASRERLRKRAAERKNTQINNEISKIEPVTKKIEKNTFTYSDFYKLAGVNQHSEFEKFLADVVFDKKRRNEFYDGMLEINPLLNVDSFKPYFELYAAERKSFQQDYTPDSVANLLAQLTRSNPENYHSSKYSGYDATAGTGALIIQKWQDDRIQETPWSYAPHRYLYRADELADNVIPYLIHNLAMRGMNAIVVHGDVLTGSAKQVYFIQNATDDYLSYSDVNALPHSDDCMLEFGITEWLEDGIEHTESGEVSWKFALPMKRKALEVNPNPKPSARKSPTNQLKLKHVAEIERAKKGKIYPKGTVIMQISATKGQIGMLKSSGEVEDKYATISTSAFINPEFAFYYLQTEMPRHINRVQEGLNIKLEEIGNCPFAFPMEQLKVMMKEPEYEQLALDLGI